MAGKYRDIFYLVNRWVLPLLPDPLYHNLLGWIMHKRFKTRYHWMNINRPQTYNEKLQWLKTHGDITQKTLLADKYTVRDYVAKTIGKDHLIPLYPLDDSGAECVYNIDDINFDTLPNNFVLKLTKGSGYNIICPDKSSIDINETKLQLKKWLKVKNYYLSREPQYRGDNGIICEKLLQRDICDYKFFCFNGEPQFLKVDFNRYSNHSANYYDLGWNLLEIDERCCPRNPGHIIERPLQLDEMIAIAKKLSAGFCFLRVDLYICGNKVYFGELTFIPGGGYAPIQPREWEYFIGNKILIDREK